MMAEQSNAPGAVAVSEPEARTLRWGFVVVWIAVLGLLGLVAFKLLQVQQGPVGVGTKAPRFTLTTFDRRQINLGDLQGQVVVLNFWASWCKPCEQEARELEQAHQLYRDRGVAFLGVDYVDTEKEALAYLERFGITYPNGPDLGTRISQAYRIRGVPETYVLGSDGNLAAVKIGPYESLDEIVKDIEVALGR